MKKLLACALAASVAIFGLTACSNQDKADAHKLKIVTTNFAEYDFARQITGDKADVKMLLKPGAESHSYEPSPQDIKTIQDSDLFVYVGGDSDEWVGDILESMDKKPNTFKLMDAVDLMEEEVKEGMVHEHHHDDEHEHEHEEHADEPEMDEHVWTSPVNAIKIVEKMSAEIIKLDPNNADTYKKNTEEYIKKLQKLDGEFREVVNNGKRKEIVVGDRFPFLYFVKEYGIEYYAAFPGCSKDTDTNPATIAFLTEKVKEDNIPVVFHIELSNEQMSKAIAEATGAKSELLNAVHNISDEDFKKGVTYIDLMEHNVEVLKEALN
ncbi:MAG: metal ABC transporter substrate-binding protein [Dialister micraerophilus]|nr:metal ABC transporter substrate-binding protein [Dialister micraerophilus]